MRVDTSAPVVVRMAGLPTTAVSHLRSRDTAALVRRHLEVGDQLVEEGEALSAAFHRVIPTVRDSAARRGLIGLRRAVFQVRAPAPGEWSPAVLAVLPADLSQRARRWRERLTGWVQERSRLPQVLADDAARQHAALREAAAAPAFRRALWLSSPSLAGELDKWLAGSGRAPGRQVAFRLAKYVARAATKTSPFSSFLVSGFGGWAPAGPAIRICDGWEPRGVLELYETVRENLIETLARQPPLWDAMTVRVNPSVTAAGGTLSFLGRPPAEPIASVPDTPAVRACLDMLQASGPIGVSALRERLGASTDCDGATTRAIARLVDIGLLEVHPPELGPAGTAAGLAAWAKAPAEYQLTSVADTLAAVDEQLHLPSPVADLDGYRMRQGSLSEGVGAVHDQLPSAAPPIASGGVPVAMDSVVAVGQLAECGISAWRPALDDLASVVRWLALFNPALPLRLAVADLLDGRGESGDLPFLLLHRYVQEEVAAGTAAGEGLRHLLSAAATPPAAARTEPARVRQLRELRREAMLPVRDAAVVDGVARVDPVRLARMADGWPPWVGSPRSLGCYVQPVRSGDDLCLVVNTVGTGFGRGGSRLAHLVARAGGGPSWYRGWVRPGAVPVPAALGGAHGTTFNEREPSVPYEVDYPFTIGGCTGAARLPLNDLVVRRDPATGAPRLRSLRLGVEVQSLDLNLMDHTLLPPAARLLVEAFGEMPATRGQLPPTPLDTEPSPGCRPVPRLLAGRVVLRRACWLADAASVPRRQPGETDADYLLRLAAWSRRAGIPSRFFVHSLHTGTGHQARRPGYRKGGKPVYVDLDSWLLVMGFDNLLGSLAGTLSFTEALPDPERAVETAGVPRVVELLVELVREEDEGG